MKHLLLVGLIFLFGACVSIPELPPQPKALVDYKAPKWVLVGGGAFTDDKGKAFYGVGSATIEARHLFPELDAQPLQRFHEAYYGRVVKELGVPGLLTMLIFLAIIVYEIFLSIQSIKHDKAYILFCSSILAIYLIAIMMGTKAVFFLLKYPANFLLYFFLGIAIKLRFLNLDKRK